jgi:hypothetical protein
MLWISWQFLVATTTHRQLDHTLNFCGNFTCSLMHQVPMSSRGSRGYRGRGRGRFQPRFNFEPSAKLQEGLSARDLDSISLPPAALGTSHKIEATNVMALGSYNWVDHPTPTMVIPGRLAVPTVLLIKCRQKVNLLIGNPPIWKKLNVPVQLEPDSGDAFIDQNTARLPLSPLEPMFRAISVTQKQLGKDFKLANENIDIVTDRNNLRKLMRFITSKGPNRDPRPGSNREFRIDVQLRMAEPSCLHDATKALSIALLDSRGMVAISRKPPLNKLHQFWPPTILARIYLTSSIQATIELHATTF